MVIHLPRRGEAGKALGVSLVASTLGGIFSTLCLIFLAPQLAKIALKSGPPNILFMIFGLTQFTAFPRHRLTKGFLSGFFGLLLSMVGLNPTLGTERFTFGVIRLSRAYDASIIGLFAVSEVFAQLELMSEGKSSGFQKTQDRIYHAYKKGNEGSMESDLRIFGHRNYNWDNSLLLVVLLLPEAYNEAKRFSKEPDSLVQVILPG